MQLTQSILVLAGLAALLGLAAARQSSLLEWQQFKQKHAKVYANKTEDALRFTLFLAAKDKINRHNLASGSGHKLGLNHMADWTPAEFALLNGFRYNKEHHERRLGAYKDNEFLRDLLKNVSDVPAEVDWRKVPGRVSRVKNQGMCGSCWAFSTTGLLEGQEYRKRPGHELSLSEQELVECSKYNYGCGGGDVSDALEDIHKMGGVESDEDYPYIAPLFNKCHSNKAKAVFSVKGSIDLPQGDETILKDTVAIYGPVAIALQATENLSQYSSGIIKDPLCNNKLNHAVVLVGYGTDKIGGDYWLVKNSWGPEWGEEGYFRMARGIGMCGIGTISIIAEI